MLMEKTPLSAAIITKNEEENLPDCLGSLFFSDQIVLVDSGSTDRTVDIARAYGCDIFIESWKGFGPQKQFAISQCRNDWVFVIDADERIPAETMSAIKEVVSGPGDISGYYLPRKNYFQDKWIRHMGWWPDPVLRLFRKNCGRMTAASVHEAVLVDGKVEMLNFPIEHRTESRLSEILKKIDHYSTLSAQEAFNRGQKASIWSAAIRADLNFIHNYFIRLGFLDGRQGLVLSITDSINKFFKYAKLYEMTKQDRSVSR